MKKQLFITALSVALPLLAAAQVEKQVEVTKAYVPSVEGASKLTVLPDMVDTVRMYPEIDYTITPLSLQTTLATRPIRPARVTYWEFNRPRPFYLKVGAGYPLNSVVDFYAATQNPANGYAVGYLNHEGRFAKIRNDFGVKNNSTQMTNRIGAAAGKYFGRHTLEGHLVYENRLYHRYGSSDQMPELGIYFTPGAKVNFGDAQFDVRFGDDFQDLSRVNFEVALHGGFYMGTQQAREHYLEDDTAFTVLTRSFDAKSRQTTFGAHAKIAKGFGRHRLSFEGGYNRLAGQKQLADYKQQQIHAAARYGIDGGVVLLEAGADYYHDAVATQRSENYILPYAHLTLNLGTEGLKPFAEIDGSVAANDHRTLMYQNPYIGYQTWLNKSSVDYNGRFGIGGSLWQAIMTYRVYAGFSIRDNHNYWLLDAAYSATADRYQPLPGLFVLAQGRQTVTSFNGEIDFRPVSTLQMLLGVHGYLYNNDLKYATGEPSLKADFAIRYSGRKITLGAKICLQSERSWSQLNADPASAQTASPKVSVPFAADLGVEFGWKLSGRVSLFAEGRNLLNRRLYLVPYYPEYGANCTIGAKIAF